jgi:hypothetical protein
MSIDIEIDKLTNSIENRITGDVFDAKTALIRHYQETLYATHFRSTKMYIETPAALRLIKQYFL